MRIKNVTTISDAVVREVVEFVTPPGVTGDLKVGNCGRGRLKGSAYTKGSSYHHNWRPFVNVYVTANPKLFPFRGTTERERGGYLPMPWLADRVEALVYVTAHELRHLWQERVPRGRRVWGARGQLSERDADAYAIRMLRAWRRRMP